MESAPRPHMFSSLFSSGLLQVKERRAEPTSSDEHSQSSAKRTAQPSQPSRETNRDAMEAPPVAPVAMVSPAAPEAAGTATRRPKGPKRPKGNAEELADHSVHRLLAFDRTSLDHCALGMDAKTRLNQFCQRPGLSSGLG